MRKGSIVELKKGISKYFYGSEFTLREKNPDREWEFFNYKGTGGQYRVVKKGRRYRFESLAYGGVL